jgi:hypothetical protein
MAALEAAMKKHNISIDSPSSSSSHGHVLSASSFSFNTNSTSSSDEWLIDSGASYHMAKDFFKRKISQNYIRIISFTNLVHTKRKTKKNFYGQKQPKTKRSVMLKSKTLQSILPLKEHLRRARAIQTLKNLFKTRPYSNSSKFSLQRCLGRSGHFLLHFLNGKLIAYLSFPFEPSWTENQPPYYDPCRYAES